MGVSVSEDSPTGEASVKTRWIAVQGDGYCRWALIGEDGKEIHGGGCRDERTTGMDSTAGSSDQHPPRSSAANTRRPTPAPQERRAK